MADCFAVTGYTGMKRREERDSSGLFKIVVKQTWYLTPTQTIRLIWDGEKVGKGGFLYISLHYHHQNNFCL